MSFKDNFKRAAFRHGSYSALVSVVVLAIIVMVNLFVRQLPAGMIYYDMSDSKLFSVGDKTKEFAKTLDEDVMISLILTDNKEDMTLSQLIKTYSGLSSYIKTEVLDPNKDFKRLSEFGLDTSDGSLKDSSVIVSSAKRFKFIDVDDIYELDQQAHYLQNVDLYDFDGEGEITSALAYVTSNDLPVLGIVTGHGEVPFGTVIKDRIDKANFSRQEINLMKENIPEKCDVLFLAVPQKDYSAEEANKIRDYIDRGGNLMIFSVYSANSFTNFNSVLEYVGVSMQKGVLFEGEGLYMQYPYNMLVSVNGSHSIVKDYSNSSLAIVTFGQGILKAENARKDVQISSLLSTSKASFSRIDLSKDSVTMVRGEDVAGPFSVAAAVEDVESGMKAVVYSTPQFISDSFLISYQAAANENLFMDSLAWMCAFKQNISIPAKSTNFPLNLYPTSQRQIYMAVTTFLIPLIVVIVGLVIWYRRRTR